MTETPIAPELLRRAADEIAQRPSEEVDRVSRVVAEALLDQAEHRHPAVSPVVVDQRTAASKLTASSGEVPSGRPLEILRGGARNESERALLSALLAHHLETLLERRDGIHTLRGLLPQLDWLEFTAYTPPYTAARGSLAPHSWSRLEELLRGAPVDGPTPAVTAALRALRGGAPTPFPSPSRAPAPRRSHRDELVSVAGELEGVERSGWRRLLATLTLWSAVSGGVRFVLRAVFALRSPATVTLDGDTLRVVGHTEILGRTLREFDHRMPLDHVAEVRRESRYPMLPAAMSVFALAVGSILGAREVIEGARAPYFPLVALGIGLLAGGILFDWVLRALFPGVRARTRLTLRSSDAAGVVLSDLPIEELDRLLDAMEGVDRDDATATPALQPLVSGADALMADTVREPERAPPRPSQRAR